MTDRTTTPGQIHAPASALAEVWSIAWPTVVTMMSYTVMQFVDALMVSRVDAISVAAQGNGGIWSFTIISFLFGIVTMVNTYVSQNVGAGKPQEAARYAWAGLWLALVAWITMLVPFGFALPLIFGSMHAGEDRLIELETGYAQVLVFGGLVTLVTKAIAQFFFGVQRPRVIAVAAISGNIVNCIGNFILIYGEAGLPSWGVPGILGTPALGVIGAAIATLIGTAVEGAIPLALFLGRSVNAAYATRSLWRPDWGHMANVLKLGWPNALQFSNEIVCWAIFMSYLVGLFGPLHLVAGWGTLRYMHMAFMPAVGFSVATTSLVGKYIGAGKPDLAAHRARVGVGLAMAYMTVCGLLMAIFRESLLTVFTLGELTTPIEAAEILRIGSGMMICAAVFQTFDALGIVYSGALRGAGDTVVPGVLTVVLSWSIIVGGGWLLAHRMPEWSSLGPWIASAVYIIILGFAMTFRFESGRWRRIRLVDAPGESA
ncbi:MAG: MATE family efflux transporter [Phycisphaerae bacterium]|jgi:MATE family multidrug resistance protein|nr:MATE family efflux transporter [Phycisphaerae bacterium]